MRPNKSLNKNSVGSWLAALPRYRYNKTLLYLTQHQIYICQYFLQLNVVFKTKEIFLFLSTSMFFFYSRTLLVAETRWRIILTARITE